MPFHYIVSSPSTALNIRLGSKEERFPIANDTTVGLIKFTDIPERASPRLRESYPLTASGRMDGDFTQPIDFYLI